MVTMCRKIDPVRRINIPIDFFNELRLYVGQAMELTIEYGDICFKPFDEKDIKKRSFVGIVRYIDSFHRVPIPSDYLSVVGFETGMICKMSIERNKIIISNED